MGRTENQNWYLDSEWLDVAVAREVTDRMVRPFVWAWEEVTPPIGPWEWNGVWLYDYEATTINSRTMRGFMSANADQIREAAQAVPHLRE